MNHRNIEAIYPLSPAQHGMFVHAAMARGMGVYFERACWTLHGDLRVAILREAWQKVIDRHPVLRTLIWAGGDEPVQVILGHVEAPWEIVDWRNLAEVQQQEKLAQFLATDLKRDFDMSKAPLMRFTLIQLADRKFNFVWSFHHLILDGWSDALVLKEVGEVYQGLLEGRTLIPEPRRPFQDYIKWLRLQDYSKAESFWREELKGFIAPTALGLDTAPQGLPSQEAGFNKEERDLSESLTAMTRTAAMKHRLTLNTVFQGLWAILLNRYSGQRDVLFGTTVYGRPGDLDGADTMVGMFLNALPFRVQVAPDEPLIPWLRGIQSSFSRVREFEFVPLVQTRGWSGVPREMSLFDSLFVFQNTPDANLMKLFGKSVEVSQVITYDATHHPLEVVVEPGPRLHLRITYDESRFERATISWILDHFQALLENFVKDPDRPISAFRILSKPTTRPHAPTPPAKNNVTSFIPFEKEEVNQSVAARFEQQAQKYPSKIAIHTKREQCTYEQLDRHASQIATAIQESGLADGDRIALLLNHEVGTVATVLGALKAGVTYVPLEPHYPQARLEYILHDSGAMALLTNRDNLVLANSLKQDGMALIVLEDVVEKHKAERVRTNTSAEDTAYILYTSGSTGKPKGVIQRNRNILHYIRAYTNALQVNPDDRLTLLSSYSHDAAVVDIFAALLNGATLYPKDMRVDSLFDFGTWMVEQGMTIYHSIPTVFRDLTETLPDQQNFPNLRFIVLGGEPVVKSDVELFHKHFGSRCSFINLYGSTESTISSLYFLNGCSQSKRNLVPIGHEIEGTEFALIDDTGKLTDIYGEIAVRSSHLALGYWRREDLTREIFGPNSSNDNGRMYRTGDLGRLLPNGNFEFLGRKDFQVKIRGFRVEPGEIEAALCRHPDIQKSVVVAREVNNNPALIAYVVAAPGASVEGTELRTYTQGQLPDYMVPATYIFLDSLPVTPNGKIDRRALPEPQTATEQESGATADAPWDSLERALAQLWSKVLRTGPVGRRDNFFELGGHSLLAFRIMIEIEKLYKKRLPLATMLQAPTVSQLAEVIREDNWKPAWSSLVPIRTGGSKPPLFLMHSHVGNILEYYPLAEHLEIDQPVYAIQSRGLDGRITKNQSIEEMVANYLDELKSLQPEGPYFLGGFCFGGFIALEAAQQLTAAGDKVALVTLIQTRHPACERFKPGTTLLHRWWSQLTKRIDLERENLTHRGTGYIHQRSQQIWDVVRAKAAITIDNLTGGARSERTGASMPYIMEFLANEHFNAFKNYEVRPYFGDVVLFRASKQLPGLAADPYLGWKDVVRGNLDICEVPGHQQNMLAKPNVSYLAAELTIRLQTIQERYEFGVQRIWT